MGQFESIWHGGGTKRQQSFLFGSKGRNALVSSDETMLSKCDDVITYATEPLSIQMRQMWYLMWYQHFLKHSDRISGSKVMKHLRTIVIFSRGWLSRSLRVNKVSHHHMEIAEKNWGKYTHLSWKWSQCKKRNCLKYRLNFYKYIYYC